MIDETQRIVLFNPSAERVFQRSAAKVRGRHLGMLLPPRYRQAHKGYIVQFGETGTTHRRMGAFQNVHGLLPDGTEIPLEVSISQTIIKGIKYYIAIVRDLSERDTMLSKIRYQTQLLAQVSDAVITTDLDFKITDWNHGAETIYGWQASEVLGKALGEVMQSLYPGETRESLIAQLMEQGYWTGEVIHHHKDGTPLHILASVVLVRDAQGRLLGASSINRDITARKRVEAELRHWNTELETRVARRTEELEHAKTLLEQELVVRDRRERALAVRLRVTKLLGSATSLQEVAPHVLQTVGDALDWQVGELYLLDPNTRRPKGEMYWHTPDPLLQEFVAASAQLSFPPAQGVPDLVIGERQALWLEDAANDARVLRASLLKRAGLHGGVAFPIQSAETTCGIVFFFSRAVRPPDPGQIELLNEIGSELSQFIIRTQSQELLRSARVELSQQVEALETMLLKINALYDISQNVLLNLTLPTLLQSIADTLMSAVPADRVSLLILDTEHQRVEHFIKSGPGAKDIVDVSFAELQEGLTGWVLREHQPALSPKALHDPRESPITQKRRKETNCGAIVVMPLMYQERLLGTITAINRPDQRDFAGSDVALMQAIANQAAAAIERKRTEDSVRYQNEILSSLNQITLDLLNRKEPQELLDAPYGSILLLEHDELVVMATTENQSFLRGKRVSRGAALLSWQAFDSGQPAILENYSAWELRDTAYDELSIYAVADLPIQRGGRSIGILALGRAIPGFVFDAEQIRYGMIFAQLVAVILENQQLRDSLREQAIRDPLTGLYNRRYMHEWLSNELQRAARQYSPTTVLMLDLDHFKRVNDTYGHDCGDFVLREVAKILETKLRGGDIACRYGGEEFLVILPGTPPATAVRRAEQLRAQIEKMHLVYHDIFLFPATVSIGVAQIPQHHTDGTAGILAADIALYHAKGQGRNRVVLAG